MRTITTMNPPYTHPSANTPAATTPRAVPRKRLSARWWGLLSLLPGAGLVLGPAAIKLGAQELDVARRKPGTPTRPGVAAVVLGILGLLVQLAIVGVFLFWATGTTEQTAPSAETNRVPVGNNVTLEVQGGKRRVLINAEVCLREGPLELLLTRKFTKEHEALLAADVDARDIHTALLAADAKEGSPVKHQPAYQQATGSRIKVLLQYEDKGKLVTVPAQQWIRNGRTGKDLDLDWVFAGSRFVDIPMEPNAKYYLANSGDLICVSNFETALLDLPINSPAKDEELVFEAHTSRIPPRDTKVTLILEVAPEPK